jgi:exopolysaccharide biosynthesis polyprenyl glycosylphosphotransferase
MRAAPPEGQRDVPPLVENLGRGPRAPAALQEGEGPRSGKARDALYRRFLAIADVVAAAGAVLIAVPVLGDTNDALRPAALALVPLVLLMSKAIGLYDRDPALLRKSTLDEAPKLFQLATLYTVLFVLSGGLFIEGTLGRDQAAALWALLLAATLLARIAARRLARAATPPERVLVLGDRSAAERLSGRAAYSQHAKLDVVGRVSFGGGRRRGEEGLGVAGNEPVPVLGTVGELPALMGEAQIDRVVIAPGPLQSEDVLDLIRLVKFLGAKVTVLPRLFEVVGSSVEFDDLNGLPVLGLHSYGLSRSSRLLKRGMDLVGALGGLLLLSPVMAVIALAIRLESPGPVLFRQRRIGKGDCEFFIFKFRTMVEQADAKKADLAELNEADGLFKITNDPRVTRVGRVLRKTSLDELPQLINVLRGEMSLVGPRPLIPDEDCRVEGWARRRLEVSPGMTGHWQVLGSSRIPLREMVKIDYLYGANWSLWGDVKLLLRTIPVVLSRRGI